MGQETVVSADFSGGWWLVDALASAGHPIDAAFWAKPSDEEKWRFYLASPIVDQPRLGGFYALVYDTLRAAPEVGLDPFVVYALSPSDPMARAAADAVKPRQATGPFATPNPKPYRGMTRYGGRMLGRIPVDGAFIYPPWEPGLDPVR